MQENTTVFFTKFFPTRLVCKYSLNNAGCGINESQFVKVLTLTHSREKVCLDFLNVNIGRRAAIAKHLTRKLNAYKAFKETFRMFRKGCIRENYTRQVRTARDVVDNHMRIQL